MMAPSKKAGPVGSPVALTSLRVTVRAQTLGPTTTADEVHLLTCRGSMRVKSLSRSRTSNLLSQEDLMQLNHLNLCVNDLNEARTFFQNYFDFQCLEQRKDAVAVMSDGHGFTLVLSNPRAFGNELPPYPEGFH